MEECWHCTGVFVDLPCACVSLCLLTAQKYKPLSSGTRFFTVNVPLYVSGLVAENFSSLNPGS